MEIVIKPKTNVGNEFFFCISKTESIPVYLKFSVQLFDSNNNEIQVFNSEKSHSQNVIFELDDKPITDSVFISSNIEQNMTAIFSITWKYRNENEEYKEKQKFILINQITNDWKPVDSE